MEKKLHSIQVMEHQNSGNGALRSTLFMLCVIVPFLAIDLITRRFRTYEQILHQDETNTSMETSEPTNTSMETSEATNTSMETSEATESSIKVIQQDRAGNGTEARGPKIKIYESSYDENGAFIYNTIASDSPFSLVTVACDVTSDKSNWMNKYLRVYLKSLVLFNEKTINLIIFMNSNQFVVEEILSEWPMQYRQRLNVTIVPVWFPQIKEYLNYPKKCSLQRMLFTKLLSSLDAIIYTDLDFIFLRPLEPLYQEFQHFNSRQMIGTSGKSKACPRNGPGIICMNTGLLLLNLTRLRNSPDNMTKLFMDIKKKAISQEEFGDQHMFNVLKKSRPYLFYEASISWDMSWDACEIIEELKIPFQGISALHGTGKLFRKGYFVGYRTVFDVFLEWDPMKDVISLLENLYRAIKYVYKKRRPTRCGSQFVNWVLYYPKQLIANVKH